MLNDIPLAAYPYEEVQKDVYLEICCVLPLLCSSEGKKVWEYKPSKHRGDQKASQGCTVKNRGLPVYAQLALFSGQPLLRTLSCCRLCELLSVKYSLAHRGVCWRCSALCVQVRGT